MDHSSPSLMTESTALIPDPDASIWKMSFQPSVISMYAHYIKEIQDAGKD